MALSDRMKKAADLAKAGVDKASEMRASHEAAMDKARANARPPGRPQPSGAPAALPMTVTSHDKGKNATVTLFPDRIERTLEHGALALSRANRQAEIIPLAVITSVTTRKDGLAYTIVSAITSGNTIDFRLRHDDAAAFKDALTKLVLAQHTPKPSASPAPAADMASQLAQLSELHASGSLTDDEFATAKAKLLG